MKLGVYLNNCDKKKDLYIIKSVVKKTFVLGLESKESYPKGFMIVAGFSYNGKLKIRKVAKSVKINEHILTPIFMNDIPFSLSI